MSPSRALYEHTRDSLPRTCGDEPHRISRTGHTYESAPHLRG